MRPIDILHEMNVRVINEQATSSNSVQFHCLECGKPKAYMYQDKWPYRIKCFAQGEHLSSSLPALYAAANQISFKQAKESIRTKLNLSSNAALTERRPTVKQDVDTIDRIPKDWVRIEISDHIPHVAYLRKRGFHWDLVDKMEVMWDKNPYGDMVMFPIKESGRVVSYEMRCIVPESEWVNDLPYRKTLCPRGVRNSKFLYGYDLAEMGRRVVLCEGIPNWFSLKQAGFNALGAFGSSPQPRQIDLISKLEPTEIVLAFDGDAAGIRAVTKFRDLIRKSINVSTTPWVLPDGKDINDVHDPDALWDSFINRRQQSIEAVIQLGRKKRFTYEG